jgi:hypothetical protein
MHTDEKFRKEPFLCVKNADFELSTFTCDYHGFNSSVA